MNIVCYMISDGYVIIYEKKRFPLMYLTIFNIFFEKGLLYNDKKIKKLKKLYPFSLNDLKSIPPHQLFNFND